MSKKAEKRGRPKTEKDLQVQSFSIDKELVALLDQHKEDFGGKSAIVREALLSFFQQLSNPR